VARREDSKIVTADGSRPCLETLAIIGGELLVVSPFHKNKDRSRLGTNKKYSSLPLRGISEQNHDWVVVASTLETHADEESRIDILFLS
jgi:hypothetical protein